MTDAVLLYVTCRDAEEAKRIAGDLLQRRLIACANILPPHCALYVWDGQLCDDTETLMLAKTRADLADAATEAICALHSYDTPCVVVLPIKGGAEAFLNWIGTETAQP